MPHPSDLANTSQLLVKVPVHFQPQWADCVERAAKDLADSIQANDDQGQVKALQAFMKLSSILRRPTRAGKKNALNKHLHRQLEEYNRAADAGDFEFNRSWRKKGGEAKKLSSDDAARILRAEASVRSGLAGCLGRASMIIKGDEKVKEPTAELAARIQQSSFPPPPTPLSDMPNPENAPRFVVSEEDFAILFRKTINGSCGGSSGLTSQHMSPLLNFPSAMSQLQRLLTLLIDGDFPLWMHPYIVNFKLVVLGEAERPICIGEWLYRCAGMMVLRTILPSDFVDYFLREGDGWRVFQFGTGVPNGIESLVHLSNSLLHHEGVPRSMAQGDVSKAFQNIDRVPAVRETCKQFPQVTRFLCWAYGIAAMVRLGDFLIWGMNGGPQGGPLAGLVFDCGFMTAMVAAAEMTEGATDLYMLAIRDDVFIIGTTDQVAACHSNLSTTSEPLNLITNPAKAHTYCPRMNFPSEEEWQEAIQLLKSLHGPPPDTDHALIAKCPITPPTNTTFAETYTQQYLQRHPNFFARLAETDPQIATLLMRHCAFPLASYHARLLPPHVIAPAAQDFDERMRNTLKEVIQDDNLYANPSLVSLSLKRGGLGMKNLEELQPFSHYASLVATSLQLKNLDPMLRHAFDAGQDGLEEENEELDYYMTLGIPKLLCAAWAEAAKVLTGIECAVFPTDPKMIFTGFYARRTHATQDLQTSEGPHPRPRR